jgi:hypothetical protein
MAMLCYVAAFVADWIFLRKDLSVAKTIERTTTTPEEGVAVVTR